MARVYFLQGTAAAYAQLTPISNSFYATTDTNELYFGSKKITNAADLMAAISRIAVNEGNIANIQGDLTTIMGDVNTEGSMLYIAKEATDSFGEQLAGVAESGAAEDVSVEDTAGKLTATNVETALAEIIGMVEDSETAGEVTMTHTAGSLVYDFYQGGQDVAHKIGTITIPEDMFVTSGELIHPDSSHPITIDGQQVTTGAYIKMTLSDTEPFYINVTDLIQYNDVRSTTEVILDNTGHVISATIGEVSGSKLSNGSVTEAKLDSGVQTKLGLASSSVQSVTESTTNGKIDVDGVDVSVHGLGSAAYTASTAYDPAGTGAAEAAAVLGTSSDTATANTVYGAKAAASAAQDDVDDLTTLIGTLPATTTASTIVGYVDEKASVATLAWGSF